MAAREYDYKTWFRESQVLDKQNFGTPTSSWLAMVVRTSRSELERPAMHLERARLSAITNISSHASLSQARPVTRRACNICPKMQQTKGPFPKFEHITCCKKFSEAGTLPAADIFALARFTKEVAFFYALPPDMDE